MRCARLNRAWFVALAGTIGWAAGVARSEEAVRPAVHLVAPSDAYAKTHDPLVAEASLRLVAAELAARYGVYARFWPADGGEAVPSGAYPRVELAAAPEPATLKHVRLQRQGDVFTFFASADGSRYVRIGRRTMEMPRKTYVGLMAGAMTNQRHMQAEISNARLNGAPFTEGQLVEFGKVKRPSEVAFENGTWKFHTFGASWSQDNSGVGPLVYKEVEGDFVIEATVERAREPEGNKWVGVACRGGLDHLAPVVGVFSEETAAYAASRARHCPIFWFHYFDGGHDLTATLRVDPKTSREIARAWVAWGSWEEMLGSIAQFTDQIEEGLAEHLNLKGRTPRRAEPATAQQRSALTAARADALEVSVGGVLKASRAVDAVLDASPTCPEAHRAAAFCGTMLALHDLFGYFHDRGRYLAGPVSHWMLADRVAKPETADDQLAGAWVMLVCGYPRAAQGRLEGLREADRATAEAKALATFITRDYRPLTPETVLTATPIEQVAWVWAAEQCDRSDLLKDVPARLAVGRTSEVYLPTFGTWGVGQGHVFTSLAPVLAYASDAAALLSEDRIPQAARLASGRQMAKALGIRQADDLAALGPAIAARLREGGLPEKTAPALAGLMDLYAAAVATPAGPVAVEGTARGWRALPPRDVGLLLRARLIRVLYQRANFMGRLWGVPTEAHEFCEDTAAGLQSMQPAAEYFRAIGLGFMRKPTEAKALYDSVREPRLWHLVTVIHTIARSWPSLVTQQDMGLRKVYEKAPGRGTWEWMLSADSGGHIYKTGSRGNTSCWLSFDVDDYASVSAPTLMWLEESPEGAGPLLARMPYNLGLAGTIASRAYRAGKFEETLEACQRLIELAPKDFYGYSLQAYVYAKKGDKARAIAIGAEAAAKAKWDVGLSNFIGRVAQWCVEENRLEEALKWGQVAARSYSFAGLKALAIALAANKRTDEARDVYRAMATRYDSGTNDYVQFLMQQGVPEATVHREIEALLRVHRGREETVARWAAVGFATGGHLDALQRALAGPLRAIPEADRPYYSMRCTMLMRQFDKVAPFADQIRAKRPLTDGEALWAYAAARLARKDAPREDLKKIIDEFRGSRLFRYHARYLLGLSTEEDLVHSLWQDDQKAYAEWLIGVELEAKGDVAGAVERYGQAAAIGPDYRVAEFARRWAEVLTASTAPPAGT